MRLRKWLMGGWRLCLSVAAISVSASALTSFAAVPAVQAQGVIVREIKVTGNRRVEPETVRSYLHFTVGDPYDAGKADSSLRALFATGLFADVEIERQNSTVIVHVVENPVVNQVAFEGNSEIDDKTLEAEVQLK